MVGDAFEARELGQRPDGGRLRCRIGERRTGRNEGHDPARPGEHALELRPDSLVQHGQLVGGDPGGDDQRAIDDRRLGHGRAQAAKGDRVAVEGTTGQEGGGAQEEEPRRGHDGPVRLDPPEHGAPQPD
jgi:hypothetical protein